MPVDVVVYQDPTYAEPWYLHVPPSHVDRTYRRRMQIEQTFRDFK